MKIKFSFLTIICLLLSGIGFSQQQKQAKYPSLLWEISGNGLKKPSYLFGTMHVSNKMVFHLSDSFYMAIRNTDAVALELNPDSWQEQMVKLEKLRDNYQSFIKIPGNDYLIEQSFRIKDYTDELKLALQSEPAMVNSLLYRSYKLKEDFEEDTFLDLYIFQTGRKLGKIGAGVEDYYESQKLILEAYTDMVKEKKKKEKDIDYESLNDITEKMQNAYRRGDLDLMDSLDLIVDQSDAFREKFIYKRNEIQANSIDTIIRHRSLFVGVGAAHLPGDRGVIEMLRKKGYILRPIKMADRDAVQKSKIDTLKVPVVFSRRYSDDGFYSVEVPGELYNVAQDYFIGDRKQYADMSNGAYYIVTRVKTYGAFLNQPESVVLKKIDSLLYENIPGKILTKNSITKNNYTGFDITSKTRIGNIQRYQIFVTPYEVIIFKMSGTDNYVQGTEAEKYFSSIRLKETKKNPVQFEPEQGGFSMQLPQFPLQYFNEDIYGDRWEYQAADVATGNAYLIMKKSLYNYNFIDEDSFDLGLIESSFHNKELFLKQQSRRYFTQNNLRGLEVIERLKDSSVIIARYFINGPHYFVIAAKHAANDVQPDAYLNTFTINPYKYTTIKNYVDTFLKASVNTPVIPQLDESIRKLAEQATEDAFNGNNATGYFSYWPKAKQGTFKSDSTGEIIGVKVQEYPVYYYIRDSAQFWKNEINDLLENDDMLLAGEPQQVKGEDYYGYKVRVKDSGSTRVLVRMMLLRNNYMYYISDLKDSVAAPEIFSSTFFNTFTPLPKNPGRNLYENRLQLFFDDLFSKDSALQNRAQQSIGNVYYGLKGVPLIMNAINKLNLSDKKYFDSKTRLIAELGYVNDSTGDVVVPQLKNIYDQTADTSLFRNEVVKALSKLETKSSYQLLKSILLKDPAIFENDYDYETLFSNIEDSLALAATLYPEILRLSSITDYRDHVINLLATLVDSGYVKPKTYKSYLPGIYIDAKVILKKQMGKDEKRMSEENRREGEDEGASTTSYYDNESSDLQPYSSLLMPFYEKDENIRDFFAKLLASKDEDVKLEAAVLMVRNDKPVDDSIFLSLAASDKYRAPLFSKLLEFNLAKRFPAKYATQLLITQSMLLADNNYDKFDSIAFIAKQPCAIKGQNGQVFFYKYRLKKTDQWKIGIVGLQPLDDQLINAESDLAEMTDVRIRENEPLADQLNDQLTKVLFTFHKSGKIFFRDTYRGNLLQKYQNEN